MSMSQLISALNRPTGLAAGLGGLVLALAACSSPASSVAPGGSQAAGAACAVTSSASGGATVAISGNSFGDDVTIQAGQGVTFTNNDSIGHTITQGTNGTAAAGACVDEPIEAGETEAVTFTTAGDYDITCKIHSSMHLKVHVQ